MFTFLDSHLIGLSKTIIVELLSRVWHFATPKTAAHQAPLSMGFSRQEHWSGLPFPSPKTLLYYYKINIPPSFLFFQQFPCSWLSVKGHQDGECNQVSENMHYKWNYSVIIVWYSVYWPFSFSHPKKSDEIEVPFSIFTEIAKALFPIFCSVSSQTKSSLELTREAGDIATAWVCFALLHSKVKWRPFSRVRLCDPHGLYCPWILQARILEWVAVSFSRAFPRDRTRVSVIAGRFFTSWATR